MDWLVTLYAKSIVGLALFIFSLAFILLVFSLAISPILAAIYIIADWYEKKSSRDTSLNFQKEAETILKECSSIHNG